MTFKDVYHQIVHKRVRYWAIVLILVAIGNRSSNAITKTEWWTKISYKMYQFSQILTPRTPYSKNTNIVLIGDEEYWKGELARRVPIKRDYLARLVRVIDETNPAVIALDFDFCSPMPDGSVVEHSDYEGETKKLLGALSYAGRRRRIVLPKTLGTDNQGKYVLESDIYDNYDFGGANITTGFIGFPYDLRRIPLAKPVKGKSQPLDSFSLAIVRAFREDTLKYLPESTSDIAPYGSFMGRDRFPVLSAGELLDADSQRLEKISRMLASKIVLVGAGWNRFAFGRGDIVDGYETPIGSIPGVFLHANYIEALLDSRVYRPLGKTITEILIIVCTLVFAILFALHISPLLRASIVTISCLLLFMLSYLFWQNLGVFFDWFAPVVLLSFHFGWEQIRLWREKAMLFDELKTSS